MATFTSRLESVRRLGYPFPAVLHLRLAGFRLSDPVVEVSLREYVERRFYDLEKQLDVRFDAQRHALEIQTKELERRLGILNHAHAQAVQNFNTFLPRETHSVEMNDWRKWRDTIDAWRNKTIGYALGSATLGGGVGALIAKLFG